MHRKPSTFVWDTSFWQIGMIFGWINIILGLTQLVVAPVPDLYWLALNGLLLIVTGLCLFFDLF